MFNYYQHRASPHEESDDVCDKDFFHIMISFLFYILESIDLKAWAYPLAKPSFSLCQQEPAS